MESLVTYESDEESRDQITVKNHNSDAVEKMERDVNYDDVEMDESDEAGSSESFVEEIQEWHATSNSINVAHMTHVLPEDSPLVFRSPTMARNEIVCNSNRRNSSDMDMDDDDDVNSEEKQHSELIEIEKFFVADGNSGIKNSSVINQDAKCDLNDYSALKYCMDRTDKLSDCHRMEKSKDDGYIDKARKSCRRYGEGKNKRCHSSERSNRRRSISRSPERPWKRSRAEKKSAAIGMCFNSSGRFSNFESQVKNIEEKTGITLPTYYNPGVMNPLKYAQQIQKRKLLWGKRNDDAIPANATSNSVWGATTFKGDDDGKMTEKFKRLMGMKPKPSADGSCTSNDIVKKQEEMFCNMQAQYDVARIVTHSQRGVGLGYSKYIPRPAFQKYS